MISIRVLTEDRQRLFRINDIDYEWVFVSNDELMRPFFFYKTMNISLNMYMHIEDKRSLLGIRISLIPFI